MAQRHKGQETEIVVIADGAPQRSLTAIRNTEVTWMLEILSEAYLGETTERKDSIFKGISGNMELHLSDAAVFAFVGQLVEKAQGRIPGPRVNIKTTLRFPSGQRARIVIPEVEFGAIPLNFGSRSDYTTLRLEYAASQGRVIS